LSRLNPNLEKKPLSGVGAISGPLNVNLSRLYPIFSQKNGWAGSTQKFAKDLVHVLNISM